MQPPVPGPLALLDTTEGFARRKKTSLWFVGSLLVVSVSILTVGLAATTRTENVTVGGYYPGITLGFGAFLGIIGINLVENRRQMDPRPLTMGRCQFFASEAGYVHDAYQTEVTCPSLSGTCPLKVRSSACYCCELYDCQSTEHPPTYYEFVGVRGCQDVLHLYRLLWASAALNVLGVLLGIFTAAVLGAFKDMVPLSQLAYDPSAPPRILYNPAQQILAYAGFCPAPATLPACSSYPLPLQVASVPTSGDVRAAVRAAHQKAIQAGQAAVSGGGSPRPCLAAEAPGEPGLSARACPQGADTRGHVGPLSLLAVPAPAPPGAPGAATGPHRPVGAKAGVPRGPQCPSLASPLNLPQDTLARPALDPTASHLRPSGGSTMLDVLGRP